MGVRHGGAIDVHHIRLDKTDILSVDIECCFLRFQDEARRVPCRSQFFSRGLSPLAGERHERSIFVRSVLPYEGRMLQARPGQPFLTKLGSVLDFLAGLSEILPDSLVR